MGIFLLKADTSADTSGEREVERRWRDVEQQLHRQRNGWTLYRYYLWPCHLRLKSYSCQHIEGKGLFTTKSTSGCFVLQHHTYTIKGERTKSKILCMQFKGILQVTVAYFHLDTHGSIVRPFAIFFCNAQKERLSGGIFTWFEMCNFNIGYQQSQHYEPLTLIYIID